jgi:hypothetical protein
MDLSTGETALETESMLAQPFCLRQGFPRVMNHSHFKNINPMFAGFNDIPMLLGLAIIWHTPRMTLQTFIGFIGYYSGWY